VIDCVVVNRESPGSGYGESGQFPDADRLGFRFIRIIQRIQSQQFGQRRQCSIIFIIR